MRGLTSWHTTHAIQIQRLQGITRQLRMPDMYRVKGPTQNAAQLQAFCAGTAPSEVGNSGNTSL